jgi:hypothetical protein
MPPWKQENADDLPSAVMATTGERGCLTQVAQAPGANPEREGMSVREDVETPVCGIGLRPVTKEWRTA